MRRPSIIAITIVTFSSAVSSSLSRAVASRPLREVLAHPLTAGDEEVVRRMVGIGGRDGDGEPVPQVLRMSEFLTQHAR